MAFKTRTIKSTLAALALSAVFAPASDATEGSFALGYGVVQRAQGGAGVAQSQDAMSAAINPASIATIGREFDAGIEFFMPFRGYEASGTAFLSPGDIRSSRNIFFIPNMAYNRPIDDTSALNFSIYGNGGANTTYKGITNAGMMCPGGPGIFCGGDAGVDLIQVFMSATYAKKMGNVSIGIAPTLAVQAFSGKGLVALSPMSSDPSALTDNGYDWSFGGGLRGGIQIDVTDSFRIGASGQTPMLMTRFKNYQGLFADQGKFNIPASFTVGASWDVRPDLTLMADYQHIFYSGVGAISNPFFPAPLGSTGGPGFGWDDVDVFKVGAEWRQNDKFTWRAGYAYSTNPIGPEDVTLAVLTPGVVQHHFTGGGTVKVSDSSSIDFALIYALSNSVTGPEVTPFGPTPGSSVSPEMHQFSASIGWKKKF